MPQSQSINQSRNLTVYAIKAHGIYGGGMAIVAANNEAQAKELATNMDARWAGWYHAEESISILDVIYLGAPKVLANFETGE